MRLCKFRFNLVLNWFWVRVIWKLRVFNVVFKLQNMLEVSLQNWILSCNLWVTVAPDVAERVKGLVRVTCEEYIALPWG